MIALALAANETVPPLTVPPLDETEAVNVTELFGLLVKDGFRLEETVVVVPLWEALAVIVNCQPVIAMFPPLLSTRVRVQVPSAVVPANLPFRVADPSVCGQSARTPTGGVVLACEPQ